MRRFGVRLSFEQQNVTGWCSFFCLLRGGKGKPGLLRARFGVLQTRLLFCFEGVQLRLQRLLFVKFRLLRVIVCKAPLFR